MNIEGFPEDVRALRQFVVWRLESRKGKETKVPYDAKTGSLASSTDSDTWSDLDDAITALADGNWSGIGFVFHKGAGIAGIDLDDCLDKNGKPNAFAREVLNTFDTYAEVSPSGTGLHILCYGSIRGKGINRSDIEIYDQGRFFTMTGNVYQGRTMIKDCSKQLRQLYAQYERPDSDNVIPLRNETEAPPSNVVDLFCEDEYAEALWQKVIPHKSQSEYDLAIASSAIHRGMSHAAVSELILLHREKWGENPAKARRSEYIAETIRKAEQGAYTKDLELYKESMTKAFFIDAADILAKPKQLSWLIKGYIPTNGIIWLAGEWSAKKTFLALHECAHIALGLEWCGNQATAGRVVYLTGEGFSGIGRRLGALEEGLGLQIPKGRICFTPHAVMLNSEPEYRNLILRIRKDVPDLAAIFIDTKSANMQGSDSDPGLMNTWVNMARALEREFDCVIIVVDHVGHMAKDRPRGASQQMGAADAVYMVECNKELDPLRITLRTEKDPKDFRAPPQIEFKAEEVTLPARFNDADNVPQTSLCLKPVTGYQAIHTPDASGLGPSSRKALNILKDMHRQYRERLTEAGRDPTEARVELVHWKAACREAGIAASSWTTIPPTLEARGLIYYSEGRKHIYLVEIEQ